MLQIAICLFIAGVTQPLAALTAVPHCPPCFAVHTSPTGYFHGKVWYRDSLGLWG